MYCTKLQFANLEMVKIRDGFFLTCLGMTAIDSVALINRTFK